MDDLISRAELFDELNRRGVPYNAEVNKVINGMPAIEQQEIIRCKDCVNHVDDRCLAANHHTGDTEYCMEVFGAKRRGEQP